MSGCKTLDGYILYEELLPVMDNFIAEEGLQLASLFIAEPNSRLIADHSTGETIPVDCFSLQGG